jgi:hypothetical protein
MSFELIALHAIPFAYIKTRNHTHKGSCVVPTIHKLSDRENYLFFKPTRAAGRPRLL